MAGVTRAVGGALTAALGLAALAGWLLGAPLLASLGPGLIPMAPSTAALLVVHGAVLLLRAPLRPGRVGRWLARAGTALAAAIPLVLLVLASLAVRPDAEHLGFDVAGDVSGAPLGHMSPVTAGCFLLASLASVASPWRSGAARPWRRSLALGAAASLLGIALVFLLAYLYGKPLLYGGSFIPPALSTVVAFVVLSATFLVLDGSRSDSTEALPGRGGALGLFLAGFALLAAVMVAVGYFAYQGYAREYRAAVERELAAVAELKVGQLTRWRGQRLAEGTAFAANADFARLFARAVGTPADAPERGLLGAWLRQIQAAHQYDRVALLDAHGLEFASAPAAEEPLGPQVAAGAEECLRAARVSFLDFYRDAPGGPIRLAVLAPIFDPQGHRPLGVVVLRVDPTLYLYPFIQRWPTPSRTAETLLVRRDGDDALFLNDVRFKEGAALALRLPLADGRYPAAQAVLGREGIVEGVDYRQVPVITAVSAVPQAPWFLIARMDAEEVSAPLRARLWELVLVIAALIVGLGAGLGALWYRQGVRLYRERYAAAEALRASEATYRTLFEKSADAILMADLETKAFRYANPAAARLLGYSERELCTLGLADIHPKEALPHVLAEFEAVARGERTMAVDIPCLCKDGSIVSVDISNALIIRDGRTLTAGFFRNITERKRAEEATAKLEGQLRTSQKMEAIGSLAGGVAHDFNNLLSVVLTYSTLLLEGLEPGDPMREDLQEIHRAGTRATELTRQLLAFSRRQVLQPQIVDLNETLRSMERMLGRLIGEDIRFVTKVAPGLGKVRVDPGQIDQVIMNLAVNARDAMAGGGTFTLETADVELDEAHARGVTPGPYVMLTATDTGVGMDPATLARIFEPFFTTKGKGKGTGLGLATVFGIVKQSGGSIWVDSAPAKGSTFKVCFPRTDETAAAERLVPAGPTSLRGAETILLVEDEDQVRVVARKILTGCGYRVLEARSADEAWRASEQHPEKIDLLLTDVVMPQVSGRQFAERLAAVRPETRVLYMSGYADDAIVHYGVLDAGISFVHKPLTPEALASRVRQVLDAPVAKAS